MLQVGDRAPPFSLQPVFGRPVRVPEEGDGRSLVLCFVRPLWSPWARAALARLQESFADFDRAGARLVAVTPSSRAVALDFVPRYHVLFPVVVDREGELCERYRVGRDRWLAGTVRALVGGEFRRVPHVLGFGVGRPEGALRRLPAEFVVRNGRLAYVRYARSITALPDVEALHACIAST